MKFRLKMKDTPSARIDDASGDNRNAFMGRLKRFGPWLRESITSIRRPSNLLLLLIAGITALNSYSVYLNRPGPGFVGAFGHGTEAKHFQKTLIFWLPDFSTDLHLRHGVSPEARKLAEEQFTQKLTDIFGGWDAMACRGQ